MKGLIWDQCPHFFLFNHIVSQNQKVKKERVMVILDLVLLRDDVYLQERPQAGQERGNHLYRRLAPSQSRMKPFRGRLHQDWDGVWLPSKCLARKPVKTDGQCFPDVGFVMSIWNLSHHYLMAFVYSLWNDNHTNEGFPGCMWPWFYKLSRNYYIAGLYYT